MAVPLTAAGNAIVYSAVPWSKRLFNLKTRSFPKGSVPTHLRSHLITSSEAQKCASESRELSGASRIHRMNSCISLMKGGRK